MAIEFGERSISVFGNKRIVFGRVDATGVTSGTVDTGLRRIDAICVTPTTYTTNATGIFKYEKNCGSAATAINGYLYIGGATAADRFNVIAIGD